jgi:hypothetical protein
MLRLRVMIEKLQLMRRWLFAIRIEMVYMYMRIMYSRLSLAYKALGGLEIVIKHKTLSPGFFDARNWKTIALQGTRIRKKLEVHVI